MQQLIRTIKKPIKIIRHSITNEFSSYFEKEKQTSKY